jgi:hypothetical protein
LLITFKNTHTKESCLKKEEVSEEDVEVVDAAVVVAVVVDADREAVKNQDGLP